MQRRAKGEGALRLRPDGRYEARLQITDEFGKRRPVSFYGRTKQEALGKLTEYEKQLALGAPSHAQKQTLSDYLTAWLDPEEGGVRDHVRPHVIRDYARDVRLYITPILGHNLVSALKTSHVQAMADKLLRDGLAPTSVRHVKSVLQSALADAKRQGLIAQNPCSGVRIVDRRQASIKYWRPDQVSKFLGSVRGHHLEAYFVLSLTTGIRIGEALALRWQDIDLDAATMRIDRQLLQRHIDGKPAYGPVKREASRREVHLSKLAITALRAHRARLADLHAKGAAQWPAPSNPIFTSSTGNPYSQQNIRLQFRRLTEAAKLPIIRVHDMRHTAASLMVFNGENIKVISDTLGHSSIRMTLDVYGHLYEEQRKHIAEGMDRLLGGKP